MSEDDKRRLMNELYHTAIYFRRRQLELFEKVSVYRLKELEVEGARLDKVLTEINGGVNPVGFESSASCICATASLLAGESK